MFNPEEVEPPFQTKEIVVRGKGLWIPYLVLQLPDDALILHWGNTTVRQFEDETYDHIEHRHEDTLQGLVFPEEIFDQFIDYDYPLRYEPLVDNATEEWYIAKESSHLDEELGDLFNEP